jgi:LacI family transcriptional regulator
MGRLAAEMLMEETVPTADGQPHQHRQIVLQPELVVRNSTLLRG